MTVQFGHTGERSVSGMHLAWGRGEKNLFFLR